MPRQLPGDVHGFVGRAAELRQLEALEAAVPGGGVRLVVVAGTAGAGKTSLAVRFAHLVRSRFPDGQLFVNLRGYDPGPPLAPEAALERFLRALGIPAGAIPAQTEERAELYRSLLAERRVLVVLDNAATVGQVRPLLPGDPGCLVVATSRGRLSGLSARDGAHRLTLGLLTEAEAVDLITAATTGHRHHDDPAQLAELADRCARLPLALRIAAERAAARPHMPLTDLIADLRGESSLWDALTTDDDAEADAVRSVFAWSYRALPAPAARVFRLLGLHPGPEFGTPAAAALTGHTPRQTRNHLDLLAGAHLLQQTGPTRYQFHDLLRAYAADQAHQEESPEQQRAALTRVAQWYLHTADAAVRRVQSLIPSRLTGPPEPGIEPLAFADYEAATHWYTTESTNLLALARSTAAASLDQITWQLSATLDPLHGAHGALDDEREGARLGLTAARRLGDRHAEATMQQIIGFAQRAWGHLEEAAECQRAALDLYAQLGDRAGTLRTTNNLGLIHMERREVDQAIQYFEESLALAREDGLHTWSAIALDNLAGAHAELGHFEQTASFAGQALGIFRRADVDPERHIDPLLTLARTHRENGQPAQAEGYLHAAAEIIAGGVVYRSLEHAVLREQAALALARDNWEQALEIYGQCLNLTRILNDRRGEALAYDGIGRTLQGLGRHSEAVDFHQTAGSLARKHSSPFATATVLVHLATALKHTGEMKRSLAARAEAETLLAAFTDPRADTLRETLRALS